MYITKHHLPYYIPSTVSNSQNKNSEIEARVCVRARVY